MRYTELITNLKLYADKPNINLNQFKEVYHIFFYSLSNKEKDSLIRMLEKLDFNINDLTTIQLTLKSALKRLKVLE